MVSLTRLNNPKIFKTESICRACGIKNSQNNLLILHGSGGFGEDSLVLAAAVAKVIILERNPEIFEILKSNINKPEIDLKIKNNILDIQNIEFKKYISNLGSDNYPDIIYLDFMFQDYNTKSQVKKKSQILRDLTKNDPKLSDKELAEYIKLALTIAKKRVILKTSKQQKLLVKPDLEIINKASKFNIFLIISNL